MTDRQDRVWLALVMAASGCGHEPPVAPMVETVDACFVVADTKLPLTEQPFGLAGHCSTSVEAYSTRSGQPVGAAPCFDGGYSLIVPLEQVPYERSAVPQGNVVSPRDSRTVAIRKSIGVHSIVDGVASASSFALPELCSLPSATIFNNHIFFGTLEPGRCERLDGGIRVTLEGTCIPLTQVELDHDFSPAASASCQPAEAGDGGPLGQWGTFTLSAQGAFEVPFSGQLTSFASPGTAPLGFIRLAFQQFECPQTPNVGTWPAPGWMLTVPPNQQISFF